MAEASDPAPAARLSLTERLSYGFGDFGYSLAYNMAGAFLLYYYTNVAKLPAAAVGTIFLAARLLDAVIDILVGIAVDKTRSRWGRTRPYFLFTAVPYAIVVVLLFNVPDGSETTRLIYAFLTFKALGILMSLGSIPYTALLPMMTLDTKQRLKLSGMRSIGTSVSVILGTAATMPLVGLFGGGDEQRGFLATATLFAGMSMVAILLLFRNCKERFDDKASPQFAVLPAIGQMLRNRAWFVCFGFTLLYFVRFGTMISLTAFFAIEVLGRPWMISVLLPAISGMLLLAAFIAPPILARTGLRKGCFGAILVSIALFAVLPLTEASPPAFIAVYLAASVATSITITGIFTMAAEAVDYHEAKFGTRNEGLLSSGISLATKIGMAVGTAMIAYSLGIAGYVPGAVTDAARATIRWSYYGWPIVLLALQAGVILMWPAGRRPAPVLAAA
ncbi:glycoside-pentoside-hexuronide (GPH):cation symporter [Sphingomonas sp. Y38-1Y]|uniref:MFS transporter n=1 Tax=Sphingomonas sp. Y38-1Y TaxID=3078265 RepID=UPI0028E50AC3|nr:glycoside-pentoside-hexuronide (GPH):cation symporter [Sphingomonas sp. Y38-1Y]